MNTSTATNWKWSGEKKLHFIYLFIHINLLSNIIMYTHWHMRKKTVLYVYPWPVQTYHCIIQFKINFNLAWGKSQTRLILIWTSHQTKKPFVHRWKLDWKIHWKMMLELTSFKTKAKSLIKRQRFFFCCS